MLSETSTWSALPVCYFGMVLSQFQLSNHLFEELAMDVYDEVDRRENDSGWYAFLSSLHEMSKF